MDVNLLLLYQHSLFFRMGIVQKSYLSFYLKLKLKKSVFKAAHSVLQMSKDKKF